VEKKMAVSEKQLETWSGQGAVKQSRDTYATIKNALEASGAPYAGKDYMAFLQGSYCNDTNIYADSDVDVVMRLDDVYYSDLSRLSEPEKNTLRHAMSIATYNFDQFKIDVIAELKSKYGTAVNPGKKAVIVKGNGSRRDADVLICAEFRRYYKVLNSSNQSYEKGVCFFLSDGTRIENFPKQHSDNCTAKHQATIQWFKPMIRVMKNMRNWMIEKEMIEDGLAPSYFLEGLLYNVPVEKFGKSYVGTFTNCINWIWEADRSKFVCANEQFYLLNESSPVTWRKAGCDKLLSAVVNFWKQW
jgi:hypothetical protein